MWIHFVYIGFIGLLGGLWVWRERAVYANMQQLKEQALDYAGLQRSEERLRQQDWKQRREIEVKHRELLQKHKELEEEKAFQEVVAALLRHDFKVPLGSILENVRSLKAMGGAEKEELGMLESDLEEAKGAIHNINNLMEAYAHLKAEREGRNVRLRKHKLSKIAGEALVLHKGMLQQYEIVVSCSYDGNLFVEGVEAFLASIFRNLISNACKAIRDKANIYTLKRFPKEDGKIRISIRKAGNGMACIEVEDNGIGMSEKLVNLLFHDREIVFSKEKNLGTRLIMYATRLHKGRIEVTKTLENVGTTIQVKLPIAP